MSHYELYTDGSHLQDWDIAGIGGYLLSPEGKQVWSFSEKIADSTLNPKHEILALEAGLLRCIKNKITHLKCFSDLDALSKILNITDSQALNHWVSRNPTLQKIVNLLHQFEDISFQYIPRSKNYKADKLSKKVILKETKNKTKLVENPIKIPQLFCAEQYAKNRRSKFFKIHKDIKHYFVFNTKPNNILDIYEVVKSDSVTFTKINTYVLHREWETHFMEIMTDTIASCPHKEIGLMIKPVGSCIDKKLRGTKAIEEKDIPSMEKFKTVLSQFDKVVINYNKVIAETVFPKVSCIQEDEIIENIKVLGNCCDIEEETYINMLQKKELGEFINLMIHHEKELHKHSHLCPHSLDVHSIIFKARERLTSQGIKLRV
jgi:ribonuclease HI